MKKNFASIVTCLVGLSIFVGCASTPKSMKSTSNKINSMKTASAFAENYDYEIIYDSRNPGENEKTITIGNYKTSEIFVAKSKNKNESNRIAYIVIQNDAKTKDKFQFSYLAENYKKNSTVRRYIEDVGYVYLRNTDKLCELESGNYILDTNAYEKYTTLLAQVRVTLKKVLRKEFDFVCSEEINLDQRTIAKVRE